MVGDKGGLKRVSDLMKLFADQRFQAVPSIRYDSCSSAPTESTKAADKTWFCLPFPVAGTAFALYLVPREHPDSPKFQLLASILSSKFIHKEVREKGGAYGGRVSFSPSSGILTFISYRDPTPLATIEIFKSSMKWFIDQVSSRDLDNQAVEEAKLSIFKGLDAPTDMASEGLEQFTSGWTTEYENKLRKSLLQTTLQDLEDLVKRHFENFHEKRIATVIVGCGDQARSLSSDAASQWALIHE
jgi:Zn-dependent M16 (insulinase) family peptidase